MTVQDCQLFSLVEDKGFKAFVNKLDPTQTSTEVMVEKISKKAKEKAIAELAKTEAVSLTVDMWTSVNMDPFLGGHLSLHK